jgi:outer membrane receptor for ferrienterochelin and colicins
MIAATGESRDRDPRRGFGSRCSFALALGCALSVPTSRAASEPISESNAVDVVDLPPLPEVESEVMDAATMLAIATSAEDIVTGAARREQSLGNVASAVTVIGADRLHRFGYRTVGEAIAAVAGIYLVDDRLSTRVGIRGLQVNGDFNTRILVIIDGTSVTESWSQLSGVGFDLAVTIDEIERIEVIRGPVSSIYGTNAFFGIINIITRGADGTERSWGRVTAARIGGGGVSAGFALGGAERQLRGAVSIGLRRGEQTRFSTVGSETAELHSAGRGNDDGSQISASLSGASGGTFAQLRAYTYSRTIPFAPYDSGFEDPYTQTNQQVLLDVGHAISWSRLQLRVRLSGGLFQFDDRASYPDPEPPLLTVGQARAVGGEARLRYQILDRDRLGATAGIEASYNDTRSYFFEQGSPRASAGDQIFDLEGAYTEIDAEPAPWLGLTAGLRFDRHSEFSSRVSPRAAAFLSRGQRYGGKLLYAQGFRNPSTYESRFDDGADLTSNPDLDAETIRSYEVVAWARPRPAVWLRASAFHWKANNIVKQVAVVCETKDLCPDVPPDELPTTRLKFENGDDYKTLGIELEASYRDRRGWYAFAGAALVDASVADDVAAGSPALTGSLGISSPLLASAMHLSSEMVVIGSRPLRESTATSDVYPEWNLAIYFPSVNGFDLTLGVRNLLGIVQQVTAAEDFDRTAPEMTVPTVPGEGRELYVRIGYAFR